MLYGEGTGTYYGCRLKCGGGGGWGCVVRLPGIGREKLTARTNKEKTYAMRPVRRTLHTLQYVKLNNPIRYSQLN